MTSILKQIGQRLLSKEARRMILKQTRWPRVGHVNMGQLRSLKPVSRNWGGDRGLPIDRYYIEKFLMRYQSDIKGQVLEVGDNSYTHQFGGDQVEQSAIVHGSDSNPDADYVADFADAPTIPTDSFDCVICTQTLHLIADLDAGVATLSRILKPGGVVLISVPGISKLYREASEEWRDYWRFTKHSAEWLMRRHFPPGAYSVYAAGNVLAATAFLQGLAASELSTGELDFIDEEYQLSIFMRGVKPG